MGMSARTTWLQKEKSRSSDNKGGRGMRGKADEDMGVRLGNGYAKAREQGADPGLNANVLMCQTFKPQVESTQTVDCVM